MLGGISNGDDINVKVYESMMALVLLQCIDLICHLK